jgi:hypothetical protein
MTFEDAASALSEAANAPEPQGTSAPAPSSPTEAQTPTGTTEAASPDSFTRSDLGALLETTEDPAAKEAITRAYKSFQGDYTRSKQALAEQYGGMDLDAARESLEFVQALQSNPDFAIAVHSQLSSALQEMGYSPEQANSVAEQTMHAESLGGTDEYEDEPDSAMAREIAELKSWKEQQEAERFEMDLASKLQREEMGIRAADPSLKEHEIDRIYQLGFATGGDLGAAYQIYKGWKDETLSDYFDAKTTGMSSVPSVPDSTGYATEGPKGFGEDLDAATKAAQQFLRQTLANS